MRFFVSLNFIRLRSSEWVRVFGHWMSAQATQATVFPLGQKETETRDTYEDCQHSHMLGRPGDENVSYWYSNCLFIPYLGHCAKLQAIINKSATDPRAADKPWLAVIDDDTIMRWFNMKLSTILDKIDDKFRAPSSPNQGWENGASWLSRGFILILS